MKIKGVLKRAGVMALALSMLIPVVPSQAAKLKLNQSNLKIYFDSSSEYYELKVKGAKTKVKWSCPKKYGKLSVSGKNNSKCKLFFKKQGKFTVTAKVGKKKLKCNVNAIKGNVGYIADRDIEYNSAENVQRVFFSLKKNDGVTRTSASGIATVNIINSSGEKVYSGELRFTKKNFTEWTSQGYGTRLLCCVNIPIANITPGKNSIGTATLSVKLDNGISFAETKISVFSLPLAPTPTPTPTPTLSPTEYFDNAVSYIKDKGELNKYGTKFVKGKVSASLTGDKITFYESYNEDGHTVEITKGSNIATATVQLKIGTATASFDISAFKGDGTDSLQWSNNPTFADAITYDAAATNVIKGVYNYRSVYLGETTLQELGFTSYAFDK